MAFACAHLGGAVATRSHAGGKAYRNTTPAPQSKPVAHATRLVALVAPLVAFGLGLSIPAAGPARSTHTTPSAGVCGARDPKCPAWPAAGAIARRSRMPRARLFGPSRSTTQPGSKRDGHRRAQLDTQYARASDRGAGGHGRPGAGRVRRSAKARRYVTQRSTCRYSGVASGWKA